MVVRVFCTFLQYKPGAGRIGTSNAESVEKYRMNSELMAILESIEQERGISKQQLVEAIEKALLTASRKSIHPASDLTIKMNPRTGEITAQAKLKVVEEFPTNDEITLEEARKREPNAKVGDIVTWDVTPKNFGRIAAQTARQAIVQQIRKVEKSIVQEEFKDQIGELVNGIVHRVDSGAIIVALSKAEGIITSKERVPGEQYQVGERISALLVKVDPEASGPSLILSRSNPNFVKKLFEREVSEIHDGVVEIVGIAREAGARTKIAVLSNDRRVDPVGACVGMRGMRVKNITNELGGERVDIIHFDEDIETYTANVLHPAKLLKIIPDEEKNLITVHVDPENSRLAFGRKAQNIKLAQKLMQWSINIVVDDPESEFEEKKANAVSELASATGLGEDIASLLVNNGYLTLEGLKNAGIQEIAKIDGISQETLDTLAAVLA